MHLELLSLGSRKRRPSQELLMVGHPSLREGEATGLW